MPCEGRGGADGSLCSEVGLYAGRLKEPSILEIEIRGQNTPQSTREWSYSRGMACSLGGEGMGTGGYTGAATFLDSATLMGSPPCQPSHLNSHHILSSACNFLLSRNLASLLLRFHRFLLLATRPLTLPSFRHVLFRSPCTIGMMQ
jgi:hypothetical protein